MTMADAYGRDQANGAGDQSVNVPVGANTTVVIHIFDDDSVFVGGPNVDDDHVSEAVYAAAVMHGLIYDDGVETTGHHYKGTGSTIAAEA